MLIGVRTYNVFHDAYDLHLYAYIYDINPTVSKRFNLNILQNMRL